MAIKAATSAKSSRARPASTPQVGKSGLRKRMVPKKVDQPRKAIVTIIFCLSFSIFSVLIFRQGLVGGFTAVTDKLESVKTERDDLIKAIDTKKRLHDKLGNLTSSILPEGSCAETHEGCLTRGAFYLESIFMGYPYKDYPEIHEPASQWVKSNCQRLTWTPHITISRKQLAQYVGWAQQARSVILQMKQNLSHMLDACVGHYWTAKVPTTQEDTTIEDKRPNDGSSDELDLPRQRGKCTEEPCKLSPVNSDEVLDKMEHTIQKLQVCRSKFWQGALVAEVLHLCLAFIQLVFVMANIYVDIAAIDETYFPPQGWQQILRKLWANKQYLICPGLEIISLICTRTNVRLSGDCNVWLIVIGITNILSMAVPHEIGLPTIWHLADAVCALMPFFITAALSLASKWNFKRTMPAVPKTPVNPHTSLQEDLTAAVEAIRTPDFDSAKIAFTLAAHHQIQPVEPDTAFVDALDDPASSTVASAGSQFGSDAGSDWDIIKG